MGSAKILLIEDHDASRLLLFNYLSKDFQVWSSRNAVDADTWLKAGNFPDLILLDWNLPHVSGAFFLEMLQNSGLYAEVPVLVISADTIENFDEKFSSFACVDFLAKPYDLDLLDMKISKLLSLQSV